MQTRLALRDIEFLSHNPVGLWCKHNGNPNSTKRVGWVGRIVSIRKGGHPTSESGFGIKVKYNNGAEQWYSVEWAAKYLLIKVKEQEMSDVKRGYIVWSPTGTSCPRVVHPTKQEAQKEAQRLAASLPSNQFYVAKLESVSSTQQVVTTNL